MKKDLFAPIPPVTWMNFSAAGFIPSGQTLDSAILLPHAFPFLHRFQSNPGTPTIASLCKMSSNSLWFRLLQSE
jgi:hypothetical protein